MVTDHSIVNWEKGFQLFYKQDLQKNFITYKGNSLPVKTEIKEIDNLPDA